MARHLRRTLSAEAASNAVSALAAWYVVALAGTLLVAGAVGWLLAQRALAPVEEMTRFARRISEERLGERLAPAGPPDELRELGETLDAMLDRLADAFDAQRRFLANASHELRTPLAVIRTEAEVALANPEPDVEELRASSMSPSSSASVRTTDSDTATATSRSSSTSGSGLASATSASVRITASGVRSS